MRKHLAAALAASLFFSGAAVTFAAQGTKAAPHKEHAATEKTAKGVVKSIDDSSLVLQQGKTEMKFTVNATTNKAEPNSSNGSHSSNGSGRSASVAASPIEPPPCSTGNAA